MDDPRLIVYVIDPELDAVLDAPGLDDRQARPVASVPAVEHVTHGEDGLERVALRASRRRDIRLAARHTDGVVENWVDGPGVDPARVILDDDRVLLDDDRDVGGDFGFLAGVERVVDELLDDHQWPLVDRVPRLVLQLALAAEFHQPRDLEGDAGQLRLGLCHNSYKPRRFGEVFSLLKTCRRLALARRRGSFLHRHILSSPSGGSS